MMKLTFFTILFLCYSFNSIGQQGTDKPKERLDFAKTYFELGGNFHPSFTGKGSANSSTFEHSASFNPYLSWGAFHFWGHAEFYVHFPLTQWNLSSNESHEAELTRFVVTGARFLPWAYEEKKLRPYVGLSWSGFDFKQILDPDEDYPTFTKDFMMVPDAGLLYGYKDFTLRLGVNYFHNNKWDYPVNKTTIKEIKTPKFGLQVGLIYSFEASRTDNAETDKKWNSYPTVSKLSYGASKFGDFFIGIGPSTSFTLQKSTYNQSTFPYLKDQYGSTNYYDIAAGYQFNKANLFTALSFRNPTFETSGYGTTQRIKKTSLALEVNKFLTDYTGFAPYIGVNVAYDRIQYSESVDGNRQSVTSTNIEPGITFGWDIVSGKTDEAFILRTNLRWYPLSSFNVEGKKFDFSQLEYNLIQLVFYPERFLKGKKLKF